MKRKYLGDSYDAVKRMWQDMLSVWAPLYAEPRFIPQDLRLEFTKLTRIPMLPNQRQSVYSILNDPDTGIKLPDSQMMDQLKSLTHISIETIARQLDDGAQCVITFDQSYHRGIKLNLNQQLHAKMATLAERGHYSFYYVSHARFLFAFSDEAARQKVLRILENAGIPMSKITFLKDDHDRISGHQH